MNELKENCDLDLDNLLVLGDSEGNFLAQMYAREVRKGKEGFVDFLQLLRDKPLRCPSDDETDLD